MHAADTARGEHANSGARGKGESSGDGRCAVGALRDCRAEIARRQLPDPVGFQEALELIGLETERW